MSFGSRGVDATTAASCEALRARLAARWLGHDGLTAWSPKCAIVLHASDAGYLREVGEGGRDTVASAVVDRHDGRITARRIDVRATQANWQAVALGHELSHVVLADRFAHRPLPRWVDEGIAILADSAAKQGLHLRDFETARAARDDFRLLELITLDGYPRAGRWGTFYGQSASLVKYLVAQSGESRFLDFVEVALNDGYEQGLRQVYQLGVAELENRWRADVRRPSGTAAQSPAVAVVSR